VKGVFLHNILCTDEACFICADVFSVQNSHYWARDIAHNVPECMQSASGSESGLELSRILSRGSYLLPDRRAPQQYRDFLQTALLMLLQIVALVVRQRSWFQFDEAAAHYGEDVR
jgi:hypothetical protein